MPGTQSPSFVTAEDTWILEQKLHDINYRYRALVSTLHFKGNLIQQSLQKHQDFTARVEAFLPWLSSAERKVAYLVQEIATIEADDISNKLEFIKVGKLFVLLKWRSGRRRKGYGQGGKRARRKTAGWQADEGKDGRVASRRGGDSDKEWFSLRTILVVCFHFPSFLASRVTIIGTSVGSH